MKLKQAGFTLVEMLFVVLIAAVAIAFAVPHFKDAQKNSEDKGAAGYLVSLANAIESFRSDLNLQGISDPWVGLSDNIEVSPTGVVVNSAEASGKNLVEFLNENSFSEDAIRKALFGFNYLKNGIAAPGDYRYFIYAGFPIVANWCGALPPAEEARMVAYMCKPAQLTGVHPAYKDDERCYKPEGWAYMTDGSVRKREMDGKPSVVGTDNCSSLTKFSCTMLTKKATAMGSDCNAVCQQEFGQDCDGSKLRIKSTTHSGLSVTCIIDYTVWNNEKSDQEGKATPVTVMFDGGAKTISCYAYWHNY